MFFEEYYEVAGDVLSNFRRRLFMSQRNRSFYASDQVRLATFEVAAVSIASPTQKPIRNARSLKEAGVV
ncbi:MAG: hypothetical protein JWO50_535 [Candidatus Kaiserbacteria bacterium]|nr:hypothetical protein [Candidatus Kaiserbacteria bacterium]